MTRCIGSLIGLKPEETERYIALHANPFPGVLRRISRSGLRHYAIFLADGILFSYLEYVGTDFDADMAAIGTDATTRQWWSLTDPMQQPLDGRKPGEWWMTLPIWRAGAMPDTAVPTQRRAFVCPRPATLPEWPAVMHDPSPIPGIVKARAFAAPTHVYAYLEETERFDADMFARERRGEDHPRHIALIAPPRLP